MDTKTFQLILIIPIIIFTFLSPFARSLDFQLDSPEKVSQDESFDITLSMENPQAIYDVKLYVNDDSKESSEIYFQDSWKSPFYYLKSVFPDQTVFQIKSHFIGETQVCAKLRNSEKTSESKQICNPITVEESSSDSTEENKDTSQPDPVAKTQTTQPSKITQQSQQKQSATQIIQNSVPQVSDEKIVLNSPQAVTSPKSTNPSTQIFSSSKEKTVIFITFFFVFICLIIIFLLSLHRL